jgi:hypothetical protein
LSPPSAIHILCDENEALRLLQGRERKAKIMTTPSVVGRTRLLVVCGALAWALVLAGCSSSEPPATPPPAQPESAAAAKPVAAAAPAAAMPKQPDAEKPTALKPPAKAQTPEVGVTKEIEELRTEPRDLGQPLVDHPEDLVRLDPKQPIWIDRRNKHVVLLGEVCSAGYPLEFFATYANRSYEAVLSINAKPSIVHAGLLQVGAMPGHPVRFQPEFVPPTGTEIAIEVRWKDAQGKTQSAPAQQWIRNIQTKKALDSNWVFAGSILTSDERTRTPLYLADSGELICVLNLPTAMLDLPIRSYAALESRLFEAFAERLPPAGTPTTVVLKPILPAKPGGAAKPGEVGKPAKPAEPAKGGTPAAPK